MIGFLHFGLMWASWKEILFMGGEYWRWTREHSYVEGEDSFASGNDFRMGTARVYAEHYLKMVLAMTNQKSRRASTRNGDRMAKTCGCHSPTT